MRMFPCAPSVSVSRAADSSFGASRYLRYSLSYRDLEEMMAERRLSLDHSTIARWVLRYAPILSQRIRGEMRKPNRSWRVDETYVR